MKKQNKLLIIICSFLLLCIVGCKKEEPKEETYNAFVIMENDDVLKEIEKYGKINSVTNRGRVEESQIKLSIYGKKEEREKKRKKIKEIEGVQRVVEDAVDMFEPPAE